MAGGEPHVTARHDGAGKSAEADGADAAEVQDHALGYKKPPRASRFRKGQSGNPNGRPKGSKKKELPFEAVLGQMVTIREGDQERRVTAEEAFLLQVSKSGLDGDGNAARATLEVMEYVRARQPPQDVQLPRRILLTAVEPGSVTSALEPLGMGRLLNASQDHARVMLEPWLVTAALARLGDRRLSTEEQETILRATRTPQKVKWPDWWIARG